MSDYDDGGRMSKRQRRNSYSDHDDRSKYQHDRERYRKNSARAEDDRRIISREHEESTSRHKYRRSLSPRPKDVESQSRQKQRSTSRERKHRQDRQERVSRRERRSSSLSPRPDYRRHEKRDRHSDHRRHRSRERDRDHRSRRSPSPKPLRRSKAPLPSQNDAFTATSNPASAVDKVVEKQKPNFGLTGKLAAASNTVQTGNQTVVLKYHEPAEARKPPARDRWRLYVFKGTEILDTVELSDQSCWLIGREVAVADLPVEHASCSKQHAALQFRFLEKKNEFGDKIGRVRPYLIDLESANGTRLNDAPIPAATYVELRDKDVLKFGHSSREYVIQLPPRE